MKLNRKIYDSLLAWKKNRQGKTALLIEGAHCIGKSYIATQFGKQEYRSYLLVDFSRITKSVLAMHGN